MHYATPSPTTSAAPVDPSHEAAEKSDKSDKSNRLRARDLGFRHIPDHILADIVAVDDPKLVYSSVHAQRDRRLRLLIRRYTNQIQHGCTNAYCSTRTCLSFRKRNATGPLRKFTELSARTLACRLIEDYTHDGKDPMMGLCQNEPVVAWYEDPTTTKKRRNSLDKQTPKQTPSQGNGSVVAPQDARRDREQREGVATRNATSNVANYREGIERAGKRIPRPQDDGVDGAAASAASAASAATRETVVEVLNATYDQPNPDNVDHHPLEPTSISEPVLAERKKDLASFTQTLFDLTPLRTLSWLPFPTKPGSSARPPSSLKPGEPNGNLESQRTADEPEDEPCQSSHHHAVSDAVNGTYAGLDPVHRPMTPQQNAVHALRTFKPWTFAWLRNAQNAEDSEVLTPFLKQSIMYCLSDPLRLIQSVRDCQTEPLKRKRTPSPRSNTLPTGLSPANGLMVEDDGGEHPRTTKTATPAPAPIWPLVQIDSIHDIEAVFNSFKSLGEMGQKDLVLDSVFTALQHSYRLPDWLRARRSGKHIRSASKNGPRGHRKRNSSYTSQDLTFDASSAPSNALVLSDEPTQGHPPLKDAHVAELCLVALLCVAGFTFDPQDWGRKFFLHHFAIVRHSGLSHSRWPHLDKTDAHSPDWLSVARLMISAIDESEDWFMLRLLTGIMDVISHRLTIARWASTLKGAEQEPTKETIVDLIINRFDRGLLEDDDWPSKGSSYVGTLVIELLRSLLLQKWDGRPIIQRAGPVAGALEFLAGLYRKKGDLHLEEDLFEMPFIAQTLSDDFSMPTEWLSFRADAKQTHVLAYSFLFEPSTLVKYFRIINVESMRKSHEEASVVYYDVRQYLQHSSVIPVYGGKEILAHMRPHMAKYFVLTIRRGDVLNDAINQIWRRERRELMRPLRVRLGKDEGEDGLDHGGVQQEFFRIVFAEVMRPEFGMFTVDSATRMAWFQPGSLEPLYRFEAMGILMSVAVYNGITLPITFPIAFYRKLLGLKVKSLDHIADGWPEMAKGLKFLLDWSDGDVGDVIARTYEFGYEHFGRNVTVDMSKHGRGSPYSPPFRPSKKGKEKAKSTSFELPLDDPLTPTSDPSPEILPSVLPLSRTSSVEIKGISTPVSIDSDMLASEAPLVTNANRHQYVKDYVQHLTNVSVAPQFDAFYRGFTTCLSPTALSIFTPAALRTVVEGHTTINIDELEATATYEEYTRDSEYMRAFWAVVRDMSPQQHRQLLEFVTASERVPVNGLASVVFCVQKNGDGDARLPSSSTCYGRLLLPEYSCKEVLREKLERGIEHSKGFGTL